MKMKLLSPLAAFLMVAGVSNAQVNVQVPGKSIQIQPGKNGVPNVQVQPNTNPNPNVQVNPNQNVNPNAQANPNQNVQPNVQAQGSTQAWRAKQILGAKVMLQGNAMAGTVEDIVFSDEGVIEYLLVSTNNKLVSVPWQAAKFNVQQQTATIDITQEQFQQVPTFTTQQYPQFYAPQYREQVYKAYNLRPGQVRRLERRGVIP